MNRERYKSRCRRTLKSTVFALVTAAAAAVLVATLWLPVLQIFGASMTPTLQEGQIVVSVKVKELELPVMADWTYPQLQIAPCRYMGSIFTDDLVIMAHNYPKHFGKLKDMSREDLVTFTDMEGELVEYKVVALEILGATAVEDMTAGEYDLTLFTCTYGGENRVALRCDRVRN